MQRFILQQNIDRFRARMAGAADDGDRRRVQAMLATVERELALLEAAEAGAGAPPWPIGAKESLAATQVGLAADFHREFGASEHVAYIIDPAPGLNFVEVNAAFEAATGLTRDEVIGRPLFIMFPENPGEEGAVGVSQIYASLRRVAETGRPHAMPILRYDVRNADGVFVERHWRAVNTPLHDEDGRLIYLMHIVDEVTDEVLRARAAAG
ncbi:PAS domain-containing protein [Phenylobacterium sp.]|uniref:PAS domain-containing protein n=1 Tax=Phenylobacterium sp. TaxID=1871053 RepID=UPI002E31E788|nr:PAS domain-containing protein [Phenylobacterium sp.]HEX3367771.1 PAS domain-containing protein [Phenylobacterium sp.]